MGLATDYVVKNTLYDAMGSNRGVPADYGGTAPSTIVDASGALIGEVALVDSATKGIIPSASAAVKTQFLSLGGKV